jgi:hypothetical protein
MVMIKKQTTSIFAVLVLMALLIPAVSADTCSFCEFINISNITRGVTDHALLTNLSADGHPQYILTNGTRAFTGKQSLGGFNLTDLLDPIALQDAATKNYVDTVNISMRAYVDANPPIADHGLLSNLSGDGHPQYILTAGTRAFTGKQSLGGFNLTDLLDPVALQDAATKNYVDLVNASQTAFTTMAISIANTSMKNYVDTANTSMKSYVDTKAVSDHGLLLNLSGDGHPQYLLVNGSRAMTGNLSVGSHYVTNVLDPSVGTDAATKGYVDSVNTSMKNYVDAANASMALNVSLNYASKIGGKVPTGELGSGTANATTYLRGDQTWATPPVLSYTLMVQGLALATVTNNTVYVFGNAPKIPTTATMGLNRIYIPKAGTIKAAEIFAYSTTAGSAETWGMDIALNSATGRTNMIQNISTSSTTRRWSNQSMNTAVVVGDYIEIRSLCPTWVTQRPAVVVFSGNIYIE